MPPARALALSAAAVAALALPAASHAKVTAAYVYFHKFANPTDAKFNLGTLELVYRTSTAAPHDAAGDLTGTQSIGGSFAEAYTISRSLRCYGASAYVDKNGKTSDGGRALPGHRVRVHIGKLGYTKNLTILSRAPDLLRGGRLGCGADPKAGVALFNLTQTPLVEPGDYFLTADAGPYVHRITWTGWGTSRAVGTGTYISDCASCGPKEVKPATITLSTLAACSIYGTQVYRHGRLTIDPGSSDERSAAVPTGHPCGRW